MYDLALSDHGDLILAGSRDLAGTSGTDLLDQRIVIRLRIHRDSWYFDRDGTLGSFLYRVLGRDPQSALEIDSYVREALRPMTEITVEEVQADWDEDQKSILVNVLYTQTPETEQQDINLPGGEIQATTVIVPFVMGE